MKFFCSVLLGLIVSGCSTDTLDKAKQDQACSSHGGVYEYRTTTFGVRCRDGSFQPWRGLILDPEFYPSKKVPVDE